MIEVRLTNGQVLLKPETEQEWLDLQDEAKLRRQLRLLFAGDEAGTLRFHDRMRDLDRRYDAFRRELAARAAQPVVFSIRLRGAA